MDDVTTSCVIDRELLGQMKQYLSQPTPVAGLMIGFRDANQTTMLAAIFPVQTMMQTPDGVTYFQIEGKELIHMRNVLNGVKAYFPTTKLQTIAAFVMGKPNQAPELTNMDLATFRTWCAFDRKAIALMIDPYKQIGGMKAYNTTFSEISSSSSDMFIEEVDRKALNFLSWQTNIYYKAKNLQAPAVIIPGRIASNAPSATFEEIPNTIAANVEMTSSPRPNETARALTFTPENAPTYEPGSGKKPDRMGSHEVQGTRGPMVFENINQDTNFDDGRPDNDRWNTTNENAKEKEKDKKKKEDDKPIYERNLRDW